MDYMKRRKPRRNNSLNKVPVDSQGFDRPSSASNYLRPNFRPIENKLIRRQQLFGAGVNRKRAFAVLNEAEQYRAQHQKRPPINKLSPRLRESLELTRRIYSANPQVTPNSKHHNDPFLTQITNGSTAMSLSQSSSSPTSLYSTAFNLTPPTDTQVVPKLRIKPDNSRVMAQCYNYNFTPQKFKPLPQLRRVQSRQGPNLEHLCQPLEKDIPAIRANRELRAMSELGRPRVFDNQEYTFDNNLLDTDFYSNRQLKPYPAKRGLKKHG